MTKIQWDQSGERFYQVGVDRGVLYPDLGRGVPWNGLVSFTEAPVDGEAESYYVDTVKYRNESSPEEFYATLSAFTYPDEFEAMDGSADTGKGLIYDEQTRKPFGISYRTRLGNDVAGTNYGYKIHIVYNALAAPTETPNETLDDEIEPITFSWDITATPIHIPGRRPTAHLTVDSTRTTPSRLSRIENILYGTSTTQPRLPTLSEILTIFDEWPLFEIQPHPTDGLAELDYFSGTDLQGDPSIGLYSAPVDTRLVNTMNPGLYRLKD